VFTNIKEGFPCLFSIAALDTWLLVVKENAKKGVHTVAIVALASVAES
jgi:hypothetical protein